MCLSLAVSSLDEMLVIYSQHWINGYNSIKRFNGQNALIQVLYWSAQSTINTRHALLLSILLKIVKNI